MRIRKITSFILSAVFFAACFSCNWQKPEGKEVFAKFEGRIKWKPDSFSSLPDWTPFDMTMQHNKDTINGEKVLDIQLLLHNPTQDSIFLIAQAGITPYYNFVVTKLDSTRVWSRIQSNIRTLVAKRITLEPGVTRRFQQRWNFTDYNGQPLEDGKYLLYGGIESLTLTDRSFKKRKDLGNIGVGPDTLTIN